jgi:hypothetical protein
MIRVAVWLGGCVERNDGGLETRLGLDAKLGFFLGAEVLRGWASSTNHNAALLSLANRHQHTKQLGRSIYLELCICKNKRGK